MTDLAFSELGANQQRIAIVLNEGMGRFAQPVRILIEDGGGRIEAGDLNGDNKPDLVVVGTSSLTFLLNDG